MSGELVVFFSSMLPITELRGSIPLGVAFYDLPVFLVFVLSIVGNLIAAAIVLFLLDLLINRFLIHKIYIFNRFFSWLFSWTRKRHTEKFNRYRNLALIILVAIPLPFTGAWTGALAAFVFGISFKRAFPLIVLGVLIAGVIVSIITLGIVSL